MPEPNTVDDDAVSHQSSAARAPSHDPDGRPNQPATCAVPTTRSFKPASSISTAWAAAPCTSVPGVYILRNSIYLSANVTLKGAGPSTVLRKAPSVVTPLVRDADWFEYGVQVLSPAGFLPGGGVMLRIPDRAQRTGSTTSSRPPSPPCAVT